MKTYTIRPLEWRGEDPEWDSEGSYQSTNGWFANVPMGNYRVNISEGRYVMDYFFNENDEGYEYADTIAAAKELAWQDWLRRITPALEEIK